jgi:MFS transporter, PAT family, beta-lactamase induction signal transducer AmpG
MSAARARLPLTWVPTAYLAEGIPFAMVIWVAGTMFKDLGHSDGEITLGTASIGIMWSLKPLWAPLLDAHGTKRLWVLAAEFTIAALILLSSLALSLPGYFPIVLLSLWLLAFASATQDICVDGTYITSLDDRQQAAWIGVQGMCWNVGRIFATALIVWLAGALKARGMAPKTAWSFALGIGAAAMAALGIYHCFALPKPPSRAGATPIATTSSIAETVRAFFDKPAIWGMLAFVFLFRTGEGFLLVEAPLFMQAPLAAGGLGLTLGQKAFVDGTVSTIVSIIAALLGGAFVSRFGLKRTLVTLAICLNVPHLCYVFLSQAVSPAAPLSIRTIQILVGIEKFGYSFGFVGNMLYMMQQIAPGKFKMTHYAFATSLMNLVLVPTQMVSGPLADRLGYRAFFLVVVLVSIPSIVAAWLAPFPNDAPARVVA